MHNGEDDLAESTDPKHWVPVLKNSFERHLTDSSLKTMTRRPNWAAIIVSRLPSETS